MKSNESARGVVVIALLYAALSWLGGCSRQPAAEVPRSSAETQGKVTLTPEQIEKIGLETTSVKATEFGDEATGYGSVIPHDAIAQAVAELISAQATAKQSRSALERTRRLSGTAGAVSADTEEAGARQAEVDAAALTLAKQRLSATFGLKPPWGDGANMAVLHGLADGNPKLVRVTFPLGVLSGDSPKSLHAAHIGAASGKRWTMTTLWAAPADANVPGRSFFAILNGADVAEGERVLVFAPVGASAAGVVIPQSALVITDSKYWCYLEEKPGTFARTEIDTHRPFENGYFSSEGIKPGDKVVVKGAAQLLAQESNSGGDAD